MRNTDPSHTAFRKARTTRWCLLWTAALIAISAGWRLKIYQLDAAQQRLGAWERACQPLCEAEAQLVGLQARWQAFGERETLVARLQPTASATQWLGQIGRATGDQIALAEIHLELEGRPQVRAAGISRDAESARQFVRALRELDGITSVELKAMEPAPRVATEAHEFKAESVWQ